MLASVASTALLVTHKYSVTYMCAMADLRRDRDFRHPHRGSESFLTIDRLSRHPAAESVSFKRRLHSLQAF